jgi:integrase/recombinase XerC
MSNLPVNLLPSLQNANDWRLSFLADQIRQGKSVLTQKAYQQDLKAFAEWFLLENGEEFRPELLNSWDLRSYRTWCLEVAKVSPATWNRRRAAMLVFCQWARRQGHIQTDPMEDIPAYEMVRQAPRWLEKIDFSRLMRQLEVNLNAANTPARQARAVRDGALIALLTNAGLRVSEACELRKSDVELSGKRGKVTIRLGKGQKQREIPLNGEARRWVSEWLKMCADTPLDGYLFPNYDEGQLSTRAVEKRTAELSEQAGVAGLTPHRLRHTCAKRMIDSGAPLTAVQRVLGHSKIETTARYAMAGWEDIEEAVEGITLGKNRRAA